MTTYDVSWSVELDDESTVDAADAAGQAWAIMDDAISGRGPATVLVVRDGVTDAKIGVFDMASGKPRPLRWEDR